MDVRRVRNTTYGNLKILPHRGVSSETASRRIAPSPNRPHSNRNKALRDHSSQRSVPTLFYPTVAHRDVIYLTLPYRAIPHGTVASSTTVSYRDGLYRMYCTAVSHRKLTNHTVVQITHVSYDVGRCQNGLNRFFLNCTHDVIVTNRVES